MLATILFVILLIVDTFSLRAKCFSVSLFTNVLTKIIWVTFSCFYVFPYWFMCFVATIMFLAAIMILIEDNAKRFFALSNIAQMCFIAQQQYFNFYFLLLIISNLVIWSVLGTIKHSQLNDHTCIENLWGLFSKSKLRGFVLIFNLLILAGIAPAAGSFHRYENLFIMHITGQNYIFWLNLISFFVLVYAYSRWAIAVLLKKEIEHDETVVMREKSLQRFFVLIGLISSVFNIGITTFCIIFGFLN